MSRSKDKQYLVVDNNNSEVIGIFNGEKEALTGASEDLKNQLSECSTAVEQEVVVYEISEKKTFTLRAESRVVVEYKECDS